MIFFDRIYLLFFESKTMGKFDRLEGSILYKIRGCENEQQSRKSATRRDEIAPKFFS